MNRALLVACLLLEGCTLSFGITNSPPVPGECGPDAGALRRCR